MIFSEALHSSMEVAFYAVVFMGGGVSMDIMHNEDRYGMPLKYEELL